MLLINASKGASQIHGIGLIARENIKRDHLIWEYRQGLDQMISIPELRRLSKWTAEQVIWYSIFDAKLEAFVLSGDDDRFTNHSEEPNSAFYGKWETIATRDILIGEEITINYSVWKEIPKLIARNESISILFCDFLREHSLSLPSRGRDWGRKESI